MPVPLHIVVELKQVWSFGLAVCRAEHFGLQAVWYKLVYIWYCPTPELLDIQSLIALNMIPYKDCHRVGGQYPRFTSCRMGLDLQVLRRK